MRYYESTQGRRSSRRKRRMMFYREAKDGERGTRRAKELRREREARLSECKGEGNMLRQDSCAFPKEREALAACSLVQQE